MFASTIEIAGAVLVTWLTWRAANGFLARNSSAGIRTRITMSSESAWRIGHRAALRPTITAGAITVVWCSASIGFAPLRTPLSVIVASMVLLGGALLSIPVAHRAVRRSAGGRALTTPMITKSTIHEVENVTVKDRDGASVGKVAQVFPSDEDGSAAFVSVATGLLGGHTALVPVEDATFDGTDLHVGYTKSAIKGAPSPGAGNTLSVTEANAVRKHFGLSPAGKATGDMGDPHENLDQAGTGPAGADDTEGAGTTPPA